jgi:hypothetical protein
MQDKENGAARNTAIGTGSAGTLYLLGIALLRARCAPWFFVLD